MLDVITCANFSVEKLRGLGNTRGQILEFPIEMAGHLYNRAGATAQPVIGLIRPIMLIYRPWPNTVTKILIVVIALSLLRCLLIG